MQSKSVVLLGIFLSVFFCPFDVALARFLFGASLFQAARFRVVLHGRQGMDGRDGSVR